MVEKQKGTVAKPSTADNSALEKKIKALLAKKYPGAQFGKFQVFDVQK
jgi:hypothetical protein